MFDNYKNLPFSKNVIRQISTSIQYIYGAYQVLDGSTIGKLIVTKEMGTDEIDDLTESYQKNHDEIKPKVIAVSPSKPTVAIDEEINIEGRIL